MYRKILVSLALFSVLFAVIADEIEINPNQPGTYVVVEGDTLWDISARFLARPWQWPEIWEVNPQIDNPHLIYPGDVISLTYKDGRPVLNISRSGENYLGGRLVKLSPSVRETKHVEAITPIPLDAIHQFLSRPRVMSRAEIDRSAYVLSSQDQHLANGAGNKIYIRGLDESGSTKYSILRPGDEYIDPGTGEVLGIEALHIGDIVLERFGDPATALITRSNREILNGDRVVPQQQDEYPDFIPRAPSDSIDGNIISVVDGVSQIGQYQIVVLNKGESDGLLPGHVLAIFQAGVIVKDELGSQIAYQKKIADYERDEIDNPQAAGRLLSAVANDLRAVRLAFDRAFGEPIGGAPVEVQLPEERAGEVMVFRTFDRVSYALVMGTHRPVHVLDKVRNP